MKIHSEIVVDAVSKLMIVETASRGGSQWSAPGVLRLVQLPIGVSYRHARQPEVKVLAATDVDLRHQGSRSHFHRSLSELQTLLTDVHWRRRKAEEDQLLHAIGSVQSRKPSPRL